MVNLWNFLSLSRIRHRARTLNILPKKKKEQERRWGLYLKKRNCRSCSSSRRRLSPPQTGIRNPDSTSAPLPIHGPWPLRMLLRRRSASQLQKSGAGMIPPSRYSSPLGVGESLLRYWDWEHKRPWAIHDCPPFQRFARGRIGKQMREKK